YNCIPAMDNNVGNKTSTQRFAYQILQQRIGRFEAPMYGQYCKLCVKAGRSIVFKFEVFACSEE
ncbi:MAG: hypothetical protein M3299_10020, partial [Thermoproteota archaeon]|nr:hypothetical protein [Thermoproteota archaeon]